MSSKMKTGIGTLVTKGTIKGGGKKTHDDKKMYSIIANCKRLNVPTLFSGWLKSNSRKLEATEMANINRTRREATTMGHWHRICSTVDAATRVPSH